jgi:putative acetyltransferase
VPSRCSRRHDALVCLLLAACGASEAAPPPASEAPPFWALQCNVVVRERTWQAFSPMPQPERDGLTVPSERDIAVGCWCDEAAEIDVPALGFHVTLRPEEFTRAAFRSTAAGEHEIVVTFATDRSPLRTKLRVVSPDAYYREHVSSDYPLPDDLAAVGTHAAAAARDSGVFYDDVLEYRLWVRRPATTEELMFAFPTVEDAHEARTALGRDARLCVLVQQREPIERMEDGSYVQRSEPRRVEWPITWLVDGRPGEDAVQEVLELGDESPRVRMMQLLAQWDHVGKGKWSGRSDFEMAPPDSLSFHVTVAEDDNWVAEIADTRLASELPVPVGRPVILEFRNAAPRIFRVPALRVERDLALAPTSTWLEVTKTGVFPIELVDAEGNVRGTGELHAIPAEEFAARFPGTERSK